MSVITPWPPGYAVGFDNPVAARFAPPDPTHAFVAGFFDRGDVAQVTNVGALDEKMGARVNYSNARDQVAAAFAVGERVVTVARVWGPGATYARFDLSDGDAVAPRTAMTVTAKTPGSWGAGLKVAVEDSAGARRIVMTEGSTPVATSPSTRDPAELVAWTDDQDVVRMTGTVLPAAVAARSLVGGTDDRANVTPREWDAALARLDRRYGPGFLLVDSTDPEVHKVALAHGAAYNREPHLQLPQHVTKAAALGHILGLQADLPDDVKIGGWYASWGYLTPVAGEPPRLVPYSAVQVGIASRVHRELGLGAPPFGIDNGRSPVTRLLDEWSDDDRHELYVAGINVATDDGTVIATWGYRTGDLEPVHQDLHHRHVRVTLKWRAEQIARRYMARSITARTLADLHGELDALALEFAAVQALHDFVNDTDSVNTPETMAARQIHAAMRIRQTPTSDWVDILIAVLPIA